MFSATTQLFICQIDNVLHMINKAFYLLREKSCFAVLIRSKLVNHPEIGLDFITSELGKMGFIFLSYVERGFRGIWVMMGRKIMPMETFGEVI